MTAYNFTGLTDAQRVILTFAGWHPGCGRRQPAKSTVRKLIARGLVEVRRVEDRGLFAEVYDVPPAVHMDWCAFCDRGGR